MRKRSAPGSPSETPPRKTMNDARIGAGEEKEDAGAIARPPRTCSSSSDSLNFLIATIWPVSLWRHLRTTPYVPSPMVPRFS